MVGRTQRIVFAGGGTGGHVFPALAVAEELRRRRPHAEIVFVGGRLGLETSLVPRAGFPLRTLPLSGYQGASLPAKVLAAAAAAMGTLRCTASMVARRPDLVVGVGGYASVPAVLAALRLRTKTMLMEQNHFPGAVNRRPACVAESPHEDPHRGQVRTKRRPRPQGPRLRGSVRARSEGRVAGHGHRRLAGGRARRPVDEGQGAHARCGRVRGIGHSTAARIIEFRNTRGHINSLDELRQIPGIGRKTHRLLTGKQPRKINRLLGVEDDRELSLQEIVRITNHLPGIEGCILAMDDWHVPDRQTARASRINSVSVFAPQLFRKVGRYTRELGVGKIQRFTIFTDAQPMTIFQAGSVYLIVVHDSKRYSKVLLRRCERISQEIARLSQQRAVV